MAKIWLVGVAAIGMTVGATLARAENISAKTLFIKDNAKAAKRQVQVLSVDAAIVFADAVDPATNGAALHLYSATDDFCAILPAGAEWVSKKGKVWKYKSKVTKNSAQLKAGKMLVKIKSGVTYTLQDNGTQGPVNAQVQFGAGTRFCMRCSGNKKNEASKFLGKNCAATPCGTEPSSCVPPVATTSTTATPTTSTTGTTCPPPAGIVLKGALPPTLGRFNYNLMVGLPAANAFCNTNFPGTHACLYSELQAAAAACDLVGLTDINSNPVGSFWAIDPTAPILSQCNDDGIGGSSLNWEYQTAHTASRGNRVTLNAGTGQLGALSTGNQCNLTGTSSVGCCQ